MAKEILGLKEVRQDPGRYRLGILEAELSLPRRMIVSPTDVGVTFNPEENHQRYLYESDLFPIVPKLQWQGSIYAYWASPDNGRVIVASTVAPYTVKGDHIIVWLARGDNFRFQPTLLEVSHKQGEKGLEVVANIAALYAINGGRNFYVGMNVQREEFERKPVQTVRTAAHFHLVRLDEGDIKNLQPITERQSRHELADSYTPFSLALFAQIFAPRIQQLFGAESYLSRSLTYKDYPFLYPKAHFFELKDGWATLGQNGFFTFLQRAQQVISRQYKELADCFTDGTREIFRLQIGDDNSSTDFFRRLLPLPSDEINRRLDDYLTRHPELTDKKAVRFLRYLAAYIRAASEVLVEANRDRIDQKTRVPVVSADKINAKMIMEGEGYNILFFPSPTGEKVLMAFVPRVTSAGSPMEAFGLKKKQVFVDDDEFNRLMEEADRRRVDLVTQLLGMIPDLCPGSAMG